MDERVAGAADSPHAVDGVHGRPPRQGTSQSFHTEQSTSINDLFSWVTQVNKSAEDAREEEEVLLASLGQGSSERYGDVLVAPSVMK